MSRCWIKTKLYFTTHLLWMSLPVHLETLLYNWFFIQTAFCRFSIPAAGTTEKTVQQQYFSFFFVFFLMFKLLNTRFIHFGPSFLFFIYFFSFNDRFEELSNKFYTSFVEISPLFIFHPVFSYIRLINNHPTAQ